MAKETWGDEKSKQETLYTLGFQIPIEPTVNNKEMSYDIS